MVQIWHFTVPILMSATLWYLHEYHTAEFIRVSRNIPYLKEFMVKIHSHFGTVSHSSEKTDSVKLFTPEELKKYNGGKNSKGIFISILGKVYDVKKGKKHYGPGGAYNTFAGRDNSRAFITGEFSDDNASDDILDLSPQELFSLEEWTGFYDKEYTYKGKLVGRYFDSNGVKTEYYEQVTKKVGMAVQDKSKVREEELLFPPCNAEWNRDTGSRVWCTTKSGGITRTWAGVPRKLYKIGADTFRCACINLEDLNTPNSPQYARRGQLEVYESCHPNHSSCNVPG